MACILFLGACSLFGPGAEMTVAFEFSDPEAAETVDFAAVVQEGERAHALEQDDFDAANAHHYRAGPFKTTTSGSARLTCTLSRGGTSTTGTVELELRSDWRHSVTCFVTSDNPYYDCFGCRGYEAFPLDDRLGLPPEDSLFIVWGGNSISDPVIY